MSASPDSPMPSAERIVERPPSQATSHCDTTVNSRPSLRRWMRERTSLSFCSKPRKRQPWRRSTLARDLT